MNKITRRSELETPKVTIGPLPASAKVHTSPEGHQGIRVPFREIALSETSCEAAPSNSEAVGRENAFRVYDSSGPYTDPSAAIDVARGLPRIRDAWVRARNVETYDGRPVRPEDNGNVTGTRAAGDFPDKPRPMRAIAPPSPRERGSGPGEMCLTQLEFARAGAIT